ncbi:hypothetical protein F5050DRAFT_1898015 [Lentinula boryana]|uniref:Uncharacterized protein n=1 Tax=Lentinula boryana TaxID=40481 RepID=A0ABQ8Q137_9AGAR|nr:hypothetical protein F5050DRAFT_1898015 [Lentinula boryana]
MRLSYLALFVTWLVTSLAYAVPMSGQASTIASLNIRGIAAVKKVEVTYNPNDVPSMLSRYAPDMMKTAIISDLSTKFARPTSEQISLTTVETNLDGVAEFTVTTVKADKEKEHKGGKLMIQTDRMHILKQPS